MEAEWSQFQPGVPTHLSQELKSTVKSKRCSGIFLHDKLGYLLRPPRVLPPVPAEDSSWSRTTWLPLRMVQRQGALLCMGHGYARCLARDGPQAHTRHLMHAGCLPIGTRDVEKGLRDRTERTPNVDPGTVPARGEGSIFPHFGTLFDTLRKAG